MQYYSIPLALLDVAFSAAFMIAVTNFYRQTAHKRGWLTLPPTHILPIVVASYLVLVAVYMLHAYLTYAVKMGGFYHGSVALGALAGGSRYVAIWLLAFHLYHYAKQAASQRAAIVEARLTRLSNDPSPSLSLQRPQRYSGAYPRGPRPLPRRHRPALLPTPVLPDPQQPVQCSAN